MIFFCSIRIAGFTMYTLLSKASSKNVVIRQWIIWSSNKLRLLHFCVVDLRIQNVGNFFPDGKIDKKKFVDVFDSSKTCLSLLLNADPMDGCTLYTRALCDFNIYVKHTKFYTISFW